MQNYGYIVVPLTALLKKNSFSWTEKAEASFEKLKKAVASPPVLRLPDLKKKICGGM